MASSSVALEDGHIRDGADEEDSNEDGANGDILVDIGSSASSCGFGIDVWWLLVNISTNTSINGFLSMSSTLGYHNLFTYARNFGLWLVHDENAGWRMFDGRQSLKNRSGLGLDLERVRLPSIEIIRCR